jgi:hypothetical protein
MDHAAAMMLFNCRFFSNLISPGSIASSVDIALAYFVDPQKRDKIDERSQLQKFTEEKKVNLNLSIEILLRSCLASFDKKKNLSLEIKRISSKKKQIFII